MANKPLKYIKYTANRLNLDDRQDTNFVKSLTFKTKSRLYETLAAEMNGGN